MSTSWFRVGHYTDHSIRTGCTVAIFDRHVPAAVDVRGGAPGTRETTLLAPTGRGIVDAIVLSGGSAFGLATVDGVMRYLSERGRGLATPAGPVPLVPAAIIYDLAVGEPGPPTADDGYAAATDSESGNGLRSGSLGAGTGATVAKLGGQAAASGIGVSVVSSSSGAVTAIVVVNAVGDVVDPATGAYLRKTADPDGGDRSGRELLLAGRARGRPGENTSIGLVIVDAAVHQYALWRCCVSAHDALARCVVPAHTIFDGDTFFAVSREPGEADARAVCSLCAATEVAVESAIIGLFRENRTPARLPID